MGGRQQDALPDHRRRRHQAIRQAVAARAGRHRIRAALRREGRTLRYPARENTRQEVHPSGDRQQGHYRVPTERVDSVEWAADNKTLFLTTEDAVTKRSDKLWRHVLGATAFEPPQ